MHIPLPASAELQATYDHLLELLRERDRLLTAYAANIKRPGQHDTAWRHATWKQVAYNQLALLEVVRPVEYADYRTQILLFSPTYGLYGPASESIRHTYHSVPAQHSTLVNPAGKHPGLSVATPEPTTGERQLDQKQDAQTVVDRPARTATLEATTADLSVLTRRAAIERRAYRRSVLKPGLPDMVQFLASQSTSPQE